jgi:hypothetical protein
MPYSNNNAKKDGLKQTFTPFFSRRNGGEIALV